MVEDADKRVFCYGNADLRKDEQADEILRFVEFWKSRTGKLPEELVFDSKLITYANLNRLNKMDIRFITLRTRSQKMLEQIYQTPVSAWRRVELKGVTRAYRTPRILDTTVSLTNYEGPRRQISVMDLGHEEPTLLLTNQLRRSPAKLISRYAQRMIIENSIADGIEFFHMDALSSSVAMKVNCDLQQMKSWCAFRNAPTILCPSPQVSTKPIFVYHGWEASDYASSSAKIARVRTRGVKSKN